MKMHFLTSGSLSFAYLICLISTVIKLATAQINYNDPVPNVTITFSRDIAEYDFRNETFVLMTNTNPALDFECEAAYPIQWIPFYSRIDDGTQEQTKEAIYERIVSNFEDMESYKYFASLRIRYKGKILVPVNFSCQAVENPRVQTNVNLIPDEDGSTIRLMKVWDRVEENHPASHSKDCDVFSSVSGLNSTQPCWNCFTKNGKEVELDFFECESSTQCNSMHSRQNLAYLQGKHCLMIKTDGEDNGNCKRLSGQDYRPKGVVCKSFGPALAQLYYFGLVGNNSVPKMYFDWTDMIPENMLRIQDIQKEIYVGENVTIQCDLKQYYFAFGAWFAQQLDGEDVVYIEGDGQVDEEWTGSYFIKLETSFPTKGKWSIFCFGPVWNSNIWVNVSINANVDIGDPPKVTSLSLSDAFESPTFEIIAGETNRVLTCRFSGKPTPNITWSTPTGAYVKVDIDSKSGYSQLIFPEVTNAAAGEYECLLESFLGVDTRRVTVHVGQNSNTVIWIIAIVASILVICGIVVPILYRQYTIIKRQREALRFLTEKEIEEFRRGNPELLDGASAFDESIAIDALPYDERYELPVKSLNIDYDKILGSGQFGKVFRGYIQPSREPSLHYVNLCELMSVQKDSDVINVAVKTCHDNVDVAYFKALLSEIKIMGYLAQNPYVVSMIGACTENIKDRKVFIAVEYCAKGSLDRVLKDCRPTFRNFVKYGKLTESFEQEPFDTTGYVNTSRTNLVSTYELLKWTLDISCGMEYLAFKKVIHADIAVRNVLVAEDNCAKIGDFGLARQLVDCSNYVKKTQVPLPWRYMPPESLSSFTFSIKSDTWAFGILCWEMFTLCEIPYPGMNYSADFLIQLKEGMRLYKPIFATNEVYEFMLKTWEIEPEQRPDYSEMRQICNRALEFLNKKTANNPERDAC